MLLEGASWILSLSLGLARDCAYSVDFKSNSVENTWSPELPPEFRLGLQLHSWVSGYPLGPRFVSAAGRREQGGGLNCLDKGALPVPHHHLHPTGLRKQQLVRQFSRNVLSTSLMPGSDRTDKSHPAVIGTDKNPTVLDLYR